MTEEPTPQPRTVGVDALKALAHPLRVSIFSALSSYGPATASALADRLGESSGATSYHLRQLEKHGFVREDTERGNARDRWWERVPEPIELADSTYFTSPAGRAAGELVEAEFIRLEDQRFGEYWSARDRLEPEWVRAAQTASASLTLTPAELARFGRDYEHLVERYRSRRGDEPERLRVDVHLRAFPVVDHAAPRTATTTPDTDTITPEGAQR